MESSDDAPAPPSNRCFLAGGLSSAKGSVSSVLRRLGRPMVIFLAPRFAFGGCSESLEEELDGAGRDNDFVVEFETTVGLNWIGDSLSLSLPLP